MNSKLTAVVSRDGREIYRLSDLNPMSATEMRIAINAHDELVAALRIIAESQEFTTGSFVCDFSTLQGVARAALRAVTP